MSGGGALRWGDLPVIRDTESGIAAIEREQMTKPRPLDVEGPTLFQPSADYIPSTNSLAEGKDDSDIDVTTQHTIRLIQYSHHMAGLIEDARNQLEQVKSSDACSLNLAPAPPLPTWNRPQKKHQLLQPFAFLGDTEDSPFVRGIGTTPHIALEESTCRQLLRRSVAAICAHAGFDTSTQSVLDTLTDVCQEYYRQIMIQLRWAADGEAYHGCSGFPDLITRIFYEMGIGKLSTVYDFYQSRVISYHGRLAQKCTDLREEYEQLRKPKTTTSGVDDQTTTSRSKDDQSSVIQFPCADDANEESGDMEQLDQLEGLGLDMNISQESTGTQLEEDNSKWKTETGIAKHDQLNPDERLSSVDASLQGTAAQGDGFNLPSAPLHHHPHHQSDLKRSAGLVSPTASFHLKPPPQKKFKK